MPVTAPAQLPLAIDRVERSRAKQDQVRLRLTGHWTGGGEGASTEALLVVQIHGRRHRFAATHEDADDATDLEFSASFTVPDWAVPEQPGQAVLWVGDDVVPVPPPGATTRPAEPSAPAGAGGSEAVHEPGAGEIEPARSPHDPAGSHPDLAGEAAGRSGPLAELLFKETVTALRAELEQRAAEAARLQTSLLEARRESEARGAGDPDLESAHAELREELRRLIEAVGEQRREFDAELSAAHEERDRVREERDQARGERDQARKEVEHARGELDPLRGEREHARSELADVRAQLEGARAELEQARHDREAAQGELEGRLATARAEFDPQLAAARAEGEAAVAAARHDAEAESEVTRQETETMLVAARGDLESRAAAAESEMRELTARLREHAAGERRRAEEAAILREQLAAAHVARDAALGEVGGLRAELERLGGELAVVREQTGHAGDELSEARQLLADARALTERLRGESSP